MNALRITLLISASMLVAACGGGGGGGGNGAGGGGGGNPPPPPPPPPSTTVLNGVVQKGPMVAGADVTVSSVGSNGNVTAQLADLTTSDNLGTFGTEVDQDQVILIEARGNVLNELDGSTSALPVDLEAVVSVGTAATQTTNVNVLTHLAAPRIRNLMMAGTGGDDAVSQAADDVLKALDSVITAPQFGGLESVGLFASSPGDAGTAYLVTISALIGQLAAELAQQNGTDPVSELQQLIDILALDLGDGSIDYPSLYVRIRDAALSLSPERIAANLAAIAAAEGSNLAAGDVYMFLDSDLDGEANNIDADDDNDGVADAQDAYPLDWTCYDEADGDGTRCDIDPTISEAYVPADIDADNDGIVYLLDAGGNEIVRWSVARQRYGFPVAIPSGATSVVYSPIHDRLYVGFDSGEIMSVEPRGMHTLASFGAVGGSVSELIAAGDHLLVVDTSNNLTTFTFGGTVADQGGVNQSQGAFAWSSPAGRLFYLSPFSPRDIAFIAVNQATGTIAGSGDSPYHGDFSMQAPLRASADGDFVITGDGDVFTSDSLEWQSSLPGSYDDLVLLNDGTRAVIKEDAAGTRAENRDQRGAIREYATFPGSPLRVFSHGHRVQVITQEARPSFHLLIRGGDQDGDLVPDERDDFPHDIAASLDTDNDGYPDDWNLGKTGADSTTQLTLDSYPDDSACYLPGHGSGDVCDVTSTIPLYDASWTVSDDDGVVYLLSGTHNRVFRWSPTHGHMNPVMIGEDDGDKATLLRYSPEQRGLYLAYPSGKITFVSTADPHHEAYFAATPTTARGLQPAGNYVWAAGGDAQSSGRYTLTFDDQGAVADRSEFFAYYSQHSAWNSTLDRVYQFRDGISPNDIMYQSIDQATGAIGATVDSPYHGDYPIIPPIRVSADGSRILLGSGDVYDANDLEWLGSISSGSVDSQWLDEDATAVLFDNGGEAQVRRHDNNGNIVEIAVFAGTPSAMVPSGAGQVVVTNDGRPEFHNYLPSDDSDDDGVSNTDDAFPLDPAASVDTDGDGFPDAWHAGMDEGDSTTGLTLDAYPNDTACWLPGHGDGVTCDITATMPDYAPDSIAIDSAGVVYLFSTENRRVFRWDAATQEHLNPIVVGSNKWLSSDTPNNMAYHEAHNRLYLGYGNGEIRFIDLAAGGSEQRLTTIAQSVNGLADVGNFLLAQDPSGAWSTHYIIDSTGAVRHSLDWNYHSRVYDWNPALDRVYFFRDDTSPNDLHYEDIDQTTGMIVAEGDSPYHGDYSIIPPIRTSGDGSRVILGSGDIYDGDTLVWLGAIPGGFADMQWMDGGVVTIADATDISRIERRDSGGTIVEVVQFAGSPHALLPYGNGQVVVTDAGRPAFHLYTPSNDSDGDGVLNSDDAFPLDPAASLDSDGDGFPDSWNPGMDESDSTTGLTLDAYPNDSACWLPGHGDGVNCDVTSTMPDYVPASTVMDGSGVVHLLSPENNRVYRWDAVAREHLNPLVVGSDDFLGTTSPTLMIYHGNHDRLYFGYDNGDITYVDLAAGPEEQRLATTAMAVRGLGDAGNFLLAQDDSGGWATHYVYDSGGTLRDSEDLNYYSRTFAWNPQLNRIYFFRDSQSPNDLHWEEIDQASGQITAEGETPYHGDYLMIPPIRISADGSKVLLGSGDIYDAASLNWLGAIPGGAADARWLAQDSTLVVRDAAGNSQIERRDGGGNVVELVQFSGPPLALIPFGADHVLVTDDGRPGFAVYTPSDDSDGDGVENTADAFPLDVAASVDTDGDGYPDSWNAGRSEADSTTGLTLDAYPDDSACWLAAHGDGVTCDVTSTIPDYVPASIDVDSAGVVYLFSPENNRVFRWDSASQQHLNPLFVGNDNWLGGASPDVMAYHDAHSRLYFGYAGGEITYIDLASPGPEQHFATLAMSVDGLADVGNFLLAQDDSGGWESHHIYDGGGTLRDSVDLNHYSRVYEWNPVLGRVYFFRDRTSPNDLMFEDIDQATGLVTAEGETPYHGNYLITPPIRVSADGARVVLGSGDIYDAAAMTWVSSIPSGIVDVRWHAGSGTIAIRDAGGNTHIERRDGSGLVAEVAQRAGSPLAILPAGAAYVIVTDQGRPELDLYTPSDDTDGDGVANTVDAFPDDVAASEDTDGDGYPDAWNAGYTEADSTTGLTLDAYPNDSACYLPGHGNGVTCDVTSTIPNYTPTSIHIDDAGIVYLFHPASERIYRWDAVTEEHLNPLIIGTENWNGTSVPSIMTYHSGHFRLYLGYDTGDISFIDLASDPDEKYFSTLALPVRGLGDVGNYLLAQDDTGAWESHHIYDSDGVLRDSVEWNHYSRVYDWNATLNRVYFFRDGTSPNDLMYEDIDSTTGQIVADGDSPYHGTYSIQPPVRVSVDDSQVLLGSGDIYDASDLTWVAALPEPVTDAEWLTDGRIASVRWNGANSVFEMFDTSFQLESSLVVGDQALASLVYDDSVVIVTAAAQPEFTVVTP